MKVSQKGLDLLKKFEGVRLRAYQDVAGIWTIGYGHTRGVKPNSAISKETAEGFLSDDVRWAEDAVVTQVRVSLTQNEFDALVSLVFNIGASAFRNSTLRRQLNLGDKPGAAEQFLRWSHAGGKPVAGLAMRRGAERELFLTPTSGSNHA
jgi:lysozyme